MKIFLRRFVLPLAATLVLWFVSVFVFGWLAVTILGDWENGRVFPFRNAHLLEEATEGTYVPVHDPAFISYSLAVVTVAFGIPAFWGAIGATNWQLFLVAASVFVGVALYVLPLCSSFSAYSPPAIKAAALFILCAALVAGGLGIGLARYVRATPS